MPFDPSNFIRGLQAARERQIAAALRAVDQFGEHVIGDAQQLTPVDTGALQASGTTEPATIDGTLITKTIGFNTNYAAAVHENLTAHHDHGQAKYLSTAMEENAPKLAPFVAGQMQGGVS